MDLSNQYKFSMTKMQQQQGKESEQLLEQKRQKNLHQIYEWISSTPDAQPSVYSHEQTHNSNTSNYHQRDNNTSRNYYDAPPSESDEYYGGEEVHSLYRRPPAPVSSSPQKRNPAPSSHSPVEPRQQPREPQAQRLSHRPTNPPVPPANHENNSLTDSTFLDPSIEVVGGKFPSHFSGNSSNNHTNGLNDSQERKRFTLLSSNQRRGSTGTMIPTCGDSASLKRHNSERMTTGQLQALNKMKHINELKKQKEITNSQQQLQPHPTRKIMNYAIKPNNENE
jgi:hypothetical protein